MRKQLISLVLGGVLAVCSVPAMAQDNEEDGDYKALMQKTTNNANGICIDYLNSEHEDYSGDKMSESRPPDEVTKGLSKAIRTNARNTPRSGWARPLPMLKQPMRTNLRKLLKK